MLACLLLATTCVVPTNQRLPDAVQLDSSSCRAAKRHLSMLTRLPDALKFAEPLDDSQISLQCKLGHARSHTV